MTYAFHNFDCPLAIFFFCHACHAWPYKYIKTSSIHKLLDIEEQIKSLKEFIQYLIFRCYSRFEGKSIKVRTALPGLPVQFSKDGGKSWHDVTKDTQIEGNVIVRTRCFIILLCALFFFPIHSFRFHSF